MERHHHNLKNRKRQLRQCLEEVKEIKKLVKVVRKVNWKKREEEKLTTEGFRNGIRNIPLGPRGLDRGGTTLSQSNGLLGNDSAAQVAIRLLGFGSEGSGRGRSGLHFENFFLKKSGE